MITQGKSPLLESLQITITLTEVAMVILFIIWGWKVAGMDGDQTYNLRS